MDGENNKQPPSAPERKRGRPPGQNRTPLTEEQRRARNAQYERERRAEEAEARSELAREMGYQTNIRLAELLALALLRFQNEQEPVHILQSQNEAIEAEIARLRNELGSEYDSEEEDEDEELDDMPYEEEELDDDELNDLLSFDHPAKRPRCDNEDEPDENEPTCSRHQVIRAKLDKGSGSPEEPQPSTSSFDTILYLTTPPNQEAVTSPDQETASTTTAETPTTESPTDTEEGEDFLLPSDDLTTLEAMFQNEAHIAHGIPFWIDLDFEGFPP